MRTMICECLPNYAGDATVLCVPGETSIRLLLPTVFIVIFYGSHFYRRDKNEIKDKSIKLIIRLGLRYISLLLIYIFLYIIYYLFGPFNCLYIYFFIGYIPFRLLFILYK